MKPGTIVVCLPLIVSKDHIPYIKWLPVMDEKTPYMIREITTISHVSQTPIAYLEEGVIGIHPYNKREFGFPLDYLRELLPPDSISEEIQEVLELVKL